jgi:hypothetical protein
MQGVKSDQKAATPILQPEQCAAAFQELSIWNYVKCMLPVSAVIAISRRLKPGVADVIPY